MLEIFGNMLGALATASTHLLDPQSLGFLVIGATVGLLFGAIPGLGGTTALALLIPLTYGMDEANAIMLMGGSMAATSTGGSLSAVLLNTPGTAPNAATTFDGYPLAEQGKAGLAIGAGATASALGGLIGVFTLLLVVPIAKQIVLLFASPEFFLLAIFGLCAIAVSTGGRMLQGLISAFLGFVTATIGFDIVTGVERFTYGSLALWDGVKLVPTLIGIFAIGEMIKLAVRGTAIAKDPAAVKIQRVRDGVFAVFRHWRTLLRGSGIGSFVGAIPGVGGTVAGFLSYSTQMQIDDKPDVPYGKGNIKGVIAPESANNAKDGGSLIPTLAFGIPGSAETAVFLGALILHGLDPGPRLMQEHEDVIFTLILTLAVAAVVATCIVLSLARFMTRLTLLDAPVLVPTVTVLALVGAFALETSFDDVIIAMVFGLIGYLLLRFNYPRITFTIAFVLGGITERSFFQALGISYGEWTVFYQSTVAKILIALIVITFVVPFVRLHMGARKPAVEDEA